MQNQNQVLDHRFKLNKEQTEYYSKGYATAWEGFTKLYPHASVCLCQSMLETYDGLAYISVGKNLIGISGAYSA